ncbi:MAG: helix-turn-helix domain-containing protein [Solirubrobacteraceae bacterium]
MDINSQASKTAQRPRGFHSAAIEYTVDNGQLAGTITFDNRTPLPFFGIAQLERQLGLGEGRLLLVKDTDDESSGEVAELTATERQIVEAAAAGASNREIATSLFYSVKSIEAYLTRIYRRFGIPSREHLAGVLHDVADLPPIQSDRELVVGGRVEASSQRPSKTAVRLTLVVV